MPTDEVRSRIISVTPTLYKALGDIGNPGEIAQDVLQSYVDQTKAAADAVGPPETIVVIAATTAMANYWVKLNSKALGGIDGIGALVITAGNTDSDRLRGVQAARLIIIRPVDRNLAEEGRITLRHPPAQVVSLSFSERLAAAWRDGDG